MQFLKLLRRREAEIESASDASLPSPCDRRRGGDLQPVVQTGSLRPVRQETTTHPRLPSRTARPSPAAAETTSGFRATETRAEVLCHFHQLPAWQSLLTVGPDAVYQLPSGVHDRLLAIDSGARQARI